MSAAVKQSEPKKVSSRQKWYQETSGAAAAYAVNGTGKPPAEESKPEKPRPKPNNTTEFLAGPSKPGKCTHGVRRCGASDVDHVGRMLTDEYLMSDECARNGRSGGGGGGRSGGGGGFGGGGGGGDGARKPKHAAQKEHLTAACAVAVPDPEARCGVRMTHTAEPMDAPYFEDNDPRPPRDVPPPVGKKLFAEHLKKRDPYREVDRLEKERQARERGELPPEPVKTFRSNKANKSVNVTNLGAYTAEELHEPVKNRGEWGPRKWTAPDPPPRRKPAIAPINTTAKQEHDVLGNGRFGHAEEPAVTGKAKGACRPPHDSANLFAGAPKRKELPPPPPPRKQRQSNVSKPSQGARDDLLRYYDPTVDSTDDFKIPPPKKQPSKSNVECNPTERPRSTGKAMSRYSCNRDETGNVWNQTQE